MTEVTTEDEGGRNKYLTLETTTDTRQVGGTLQSERDRHYEGRGVYRRIYALVHAAKCILLSKLDFCLLFTLTRTQRILVKVRRLRFSRYFKSFFERQIL